MTTPDELTAIERRLPYLDKDTIPRLINALRERDAEIERLRGQVEIRQRVINRLPLCPDHRDKVRDRCCECECEKLRADLAKLRAERDELNHLKIAMHEIEQMTWGGKGESAVHVVAANALNEIIKSQRQRRIATGEP